MIDRTISSSGVEMNIASILEKSAFYFPQRPAVSDGNNETSYSELDSIANRFATSLCNKGIRPGDRVAICTPNSLEWIGFYFGVLKARGGSSPLAFSTETE